VTQSDQGLLISVMLTMPESKWLSKLPIPDSNMLVLVLQVWSPRARRPVTYQERLLDLSGAAPDSLAGMSSKKTKTPTP
jgi:hypothetical protein